MTKRECAIVMAYTGTTMLEGEDLNIFYKYLQEIMGRAVYTHEIPWLSKVIKKQSTQDFIELCAGATD